MIGKLFRSCSFSTLALSFGLGQVLSLWLFGLQAATMECAPLMTRHLLRDFPRSDIQLEPTRFRRNAYMYEDGCRIPLQ